MKTHTKTRPRAALAGFVGRDQAPLREGDKELEVGDGNKEAGWDLVQGGECQGEEGVLGVMLPQLPLVGEAMPMVGGGLLLVVPMMGGGEGKPEATPPKLLQVRGAGNETTAPLRREKSI